MSFTDDVRIIMRFVADGKTLDDSLKKADVAIKKTEANISNSFQKTFGGIAKLLGGVFAVKSIIGFADTYSSALGKIKLSADDATKSLEEIYQMSQESGTDFVSNADLFSTIASNKDKIGLDDDQTLKMVDVVAKSIAMTSAGKAQDSGAVLQISQALAGETVQSMDLKAAMNNSQGLAKTLEEAFGKSRAELLAMAGQGKLTTKELADALLSQTDSINEKVKQIPLTFGQAWTKISNSLTKSFGKWNQNFRVADKLNKVAGFIAQNLEKILKTSAFVLIVWKANVLQAKLQAFWQGVTAKNARALGFALNANIKKFAKMALLIYGIYLIVDDIIVWLKGGDSVLGDLIGGVEEWQDKIDGVKNKFNEITKSIGVSIDNVMIFLKKWVAILAVGFVFIKALVFIWKTLGFVLKLVKWILLPLKIIAFVIASVAGVIGTLAMAVLIAIIGLLVIIWNYWDEIKEAGVKAWNYIKDKAKQTWDYIKNKAKQTWNSIKAWSKAVWNGVTQTAKNTWNAIKDFASNTWQKTKDIATSVWDSISSYGMTAWTTLSEFATALFSGDFEQVGNIVKETFDKVIDAVKKAFNDFMTWLLGQFGISWDGIKQKMIDSVKGAIDEMKRLFREAKESITNIWDGAKSIFSFGGQKPVVTNLPPSVNNKNSTSNQEITLTQYFSGLKNPSKAGLENALGIKNRFPQTQLYATESN